MGQRFRIYVAAGREDQHSYFQPWTTTFADSLDAAADCFLAYCQHYNRVAQARADIDPRRVLDRFQFLVHHISMLEDGSTVGDDEAMLITMDKNEEQERTLVPFGEN